MRKRLIGISIVGDGLLGNMLLVGYRDFYTKVSPGNWEGRLGLFRLEGLY